MKKSTRRATSSVSRKAKSPSRHLATKSARRSSLKSKVAVSPRAKPRKKVTARSKRKIGLAVVASPSGRRLVSRVKRSISSAIASR